MPTNAREFNVEISLTADERISVDRKDSLLFFLETVEKLKSAYSIFL